MPKPISNPLPAYGSAEWRAERAKMVGTPEWRVANNQATLDESVQFKTDEYIRDWINYEISQGKDRPTANQISAKRAELDPQFRKSLSPSADPQDQKMVTGANILTRINDQGEKESYYGVNPLRQDAPHSELYNRLLQSGGMKEGIPIDPWSLGGKYNPGPQVKMPSATTTKANNNLNSSTSNLIQSVQGQNALVPSYSTPTATQPKIELPQMFQANFNAPSTTPPNAPNGITMPNWAGQKPKGGFGSNWNDLLSVAYNRQPR